MEFKLPYYADVPKMRTSQLDPRLMGRASKSSKFTNTITQHGFWRDTSISAATREKKRHEVVLKRKHNKMDQLSSQFERESRKIEQLQKQLASNQREMACIAMEKYTAAYIQSIVRGWMGRVYWKQVHAARLLKQWLKFRMYFIERKYAWKNVIRRAINCFLAKKRMHSVSLYIAAVKSIQRFYHRRYLVKVSVVRVRTMILWNDVKHLAISRATHVISEEARSQLVLNRFMHGFVRRQRLRRLGNPQGYNRIFYSLFHCQKDQLKRMLEEDSAALSAATETGDTTNSEYEVQGSDIQTHESLSSGDVVVLSRRKLGDLSSAELEQRLELAKGIRTSNHMQQYIRDKASAIRVKVRQCYK